MQYAALNHLERRHARLSAADAVELGWAQAKTLRIKPERLLFAEMVVDQCDESPYMPGGAGRGDWLRHAAGLRGPRKAQ